MLLTRMADGRHFTDYRPSCELNNDISRDNNLNNSLDIRLFLQRNAEKLMDVNRNMACEKIVMVFVERMLKVI